jgi:hypothetical protein
MRTESHGGEGACSTVFVVPRKSTKPPPPEEMRVIPSLRLPAALIDRLDALVELRGRRGWPVARTVVIRLALAEGLTVLEAREREGGGE